MTAADLVHPKDTTLWRELGSNPDWILNEVDGLSLIVCTLGKDQREVQNPRKCFSRTQSPLVDEKEDAKGLYLGTKNPLIKKEPDVSVHIRLPAHPSLAFPLTLPVHVSGTRTDSSSELERLTAQPSGGPSCAQEASRKDETHSACTCPLPPRLTERRHA